MCRNNIDKFLHENNYYKIIIKTITINDNIAYNNYVRRNKIYNKCFLLIMSLLSFYSIYIYFDYTNKLYNISNMLNICNDNVTKLNNIISDYEKIYVYDNRIHKMIKCIFPMYFVNICFN